MFAKLADGGFAVCGRKGTSTDVSRKPAVRPSLCHRPLPCPVDGQTGLQGVLAPTSSAAEDWGPPLLSCPAPQVRRSSSGVLGEGGSPVDGKGSGKRVRARGGADSGKGKRTKQAQAAQAVSGGRRARHVDMDWAPLFLH